MGVASSGIWALASNINISFVPIMPMDHCNTTHLQNKQTQYPQQCPWAFSDPCPSLIFAFRAAAGIIQTALLFIPGLIHNLLINTHTVVLDARYPQGSWAPGSGCPSPAMTPRCAAPPHHRGHCAETLSLKPSGSTVAWSPNTHGEGDLEHVVQRHSRFQRCEKLQRKQLTFRHVTVAQEQ